MSGAVVFAAFLMLAAASADERDVGCVLQQIAPQDSQAVANAMLVGKKAPTEVMARWGAAQRVCMTRYKWDRARLDRVAMMVTGRLISREMAARLTDAGIDVTAIDRWFDRQSPAFRVGAYIAMDGKQADKTLASLGGREVPAILLQTYWADVRDYVQSKAVFEREAQGLPDPK